MSSQESASVEQLQQRKKRRRWNNNNRGPPSRLDWMGGGFGLGGQESDGKIVTLSTGTENDDSNDEKMLTPRADAAEIDLTGDSDEEINNKKKVGIELNKQWKCQRCTLLNPQSSSVCDACQGRRESSRHSVKKENNRNGDDSTDSEFPTIKMKKDNFNRKKSSSTRRNTKATSLKALKSQPLKRSTSSSRNSKKAFTVTSHDKRQTNQCKEMWTDKHAPKCAKDLCVAPKKIEEVRKWLTSHSNTRQTKRESKAEKELDPWEIPDEWEADVMTFDAKMIIVVGSNGIGKSTMIHCLAAELNLEILTWNDAHTDFVDNQFQSLDSYLPYQSQINSFEEFLTSGGAGMDTLQLKVDEDGATKVGSKKKEQTHGSIILIEELPNLYNAKATQSFRDLMERNIQRSTVPMVFVYSDVHEGKHKPEDLENLIPSHILYSDLVQILPIQPATKAKMKKCLQAIVKAEGVGTLPPDFFEEMHLTSGGDMRHAVMAMQFQFSTTNKRHGKKEATKRDTKLSMFHALGKLIHAKRKPHCQDTPEETKRWDDGRGPLEFDPEDILSRSGMTVGSAVSFLSYHCPDYFSDITELSNAFDRFSEADMFVNKFYQGGGQSTLEYAASVGSRAIADSNRTPAPTSFRPLSAPKVFSVMTKSSQNEVKMGQLCKRLSLGSGKMTLDSNIGSTHHFVMESLPHMRHILPEEVNYALSQLHSHFGDKTANKSDESQEELRARDNEVLLEDDIVDDDDW